MESTSQKKIIVSYFITSAIIFMISALTNVMGVFGNGVGEAASTMSIELMAIIQLAVVLTANCFLHFVFYYGGFKSSPIAKGIGIGAFLGLTYFLVTVFAFNFYDINADPLLQIAGGMSGRMIEYSSGGVLTALISVSDIHKWGLLRAF